MLHKEPDRSAIDQNEKHTSEDGEPRSYEDLVFDSQINHPICSGNTRSEDRAEFDRCRSRLCQGTNLSE
jgi:hypothetical protein